MRVPDDIFRDSLRDVLLSDFPAAPKRLGGIQKVDRSLADALAICRAILERYERGISLKEAVKAKQEES